MQKENFLSDVEWQHLQQLVEEGYVRCAKHPKYPLTIYTYSSKCEQEEYWENLTLRSRGLVIDDETHEIIINPIPKFFNHNTKFAPYIDIHDANTIITVKEDGFLLQFRFHPKYGLIVTSKGSFTSPMALDAEQYLLKNGIEKEAASLPLTYICEWCKDYPDCAGFIVTKHPQERLVCFAVRTTEGKEYKVESIYLPSYIEKIKTFTPQEAYNYLENKVEGIVLKNKENRVKVKTQWFLEAHRSIAHCTKKTVWKLLQIGETIDELENIPDEFLPQMQKWQAELTTAFEKDKNWAEEWEDVIFNIQKMSEKGLAQNTSLGLSKYQKNLVFALHNDKVSKLYELIWRKLKPKGNE